MSTLIYSLLAILTIAVTGSLVAATSKKTWLFVKEHNAPKFKPSAAHGVILQICLIYCWAMFVYRLLSGVSALELGAVAVCLVGLLAMRVHVLVPQKAEA